MCFFNCGLWGCINRWFACQLWILRRCTNRLPDVLAYRATPQDDIESGGIHESVSTERLQDEIRRLHADVGDRSQELMRLQRHYSELRAQCSDVTKEKEDALRRLSEVMSLKLRDNNPNIVDLSDQFRPTKLAEISGELYDNEWTTAFESLDNLPGHLGERSHIQFLLDILMETYTFCKQRHEKEWQNVLTGIWGVNQNPSKEDMKTLKDLRKKFARDRLAAMQQTCVQHLTPLYQTDYNCFHVESILNYVHVCGKLCWLMQVQDPPVVFKCINWRSRADNQPTNGGSQLSDQARDTNQALPSVTYEVEMDTLADLRNTDRVVFDKGLYREYTSKGNFVDFVVWPVMYLHEGGPLLNKGVAQGCD